MKINTARSIYPIRFVKTLYKGTSFISEEVIQVESSFEFNSLLAEIKQYNEDPSNEEITQYYKLTRLY